MKRRRLFVVALLAIVLPSLSQAADARPVRPGTDIIGGVPTGTGEFPFMAAILDESFGGNDYNKQFCGGSLIAPTWVLTAAHCVAGTSPNQLAVAVGRTDLSNGNQGERRSVAAVHVHTSYGEPTNFAHDAALLRLSSAVTAAPIGLPATTDNRFEDANDMLTVIGWGTRRAGRPDYPDALYKVDVPVVSDATCRGSYGASLHEATMVCAGAPGIDSCYGDSGGPMFANDGSSRLQIGIVSWGNGCAKKRFPGVYSEVNSSSIRSWIFTNAGV